MITALALGAIGAVLLLACFAAALRRGVRHLNAGLCAHELEDIDEQYAALCSAEGGDDAR